MNNFFNLTKQGKERTFQGRGFCGIGFSTLTRGKLSNWMPWGRARGRQVEYEKKRKINPKVTQLSVVGSNPGRGSLISAHPNRNRPCTYIRG